MFGTAVVRFVRIALCKFVLLSYYTLCAIVYETAASALGFHKYSTTFHMLQQMVFMHKLSASVFMRVNYNLRIATATRVSMYSLQ